MSRKFTTGDIVEFCRADYTSKGVVLGYINDHGSVVTVEFEKPTPTHDSRCDPHGKPGYTWFVAEENLRLVQSILMSWD